MMENELKDVGCRIVSFDDISRRKQEVLVDIQIQQKNLKNEIGNLFEGYRQPSNFFSIAGIRKTSGMVSGAIYFVRILKSITHLTGFLKKH